MSIINGIIQAPVSIADVKTALGETSNDLAALCRSDKINMWAKFKPVELNKPFTSDELILKIIVGVTMQRGSRERTLRVSGYAV